MNKRGQKLRSTIAERVKKAGRYQFSFSSVLIGGSLLLLVGIGVGATTNIWNSGLRTLGLKPDVPALDFSSLQRTYDSLAAYYDGDIDPAKAIDGANHGLVSAMGDPYTVYFNADEAKEFSNDLSGSFSGIGAALALKDNVVTVSSVLEGSPAKASGVKGGDQIVAVDDESTQGWSIDKAVSEIRGEAGSKVKLLIIRGDTRQDITVTRADLTNPSVTSEVVDGIGVLSISRFGDNTSRLARTAAESFKDQGVKGVVLDLRGNGGGYVDAAQAIASLWLDDKVVVSERTGGTVIDTLRSAKDPVLNGVPTIVLIDGGSASASEIVAGALLDNDAAQLLGEKSFGKGSVQSVLGLPGGNELKVTIARWYTPDGKNIDKTGITPGTIVSPTAEQIEAGEDPAKSAALAKLRE